MLHGMVQNEDDSWDLAQEAFLKAWRSIHQFQGRSWFYTWLYSLTVNLAFDSLRRKGRRVEVELDDAIPSSLPSPAPTIYALRSVSTSTPHLHNLLQNIALLSF